MQRLAHRGGRRYVLKRWCCSASLCCTLPTTPNG
ncbi:hypothetical protein BN439_2631 [Erwinia amylovora Ea644]|nr:hypothetical protein BN439_2631 [Erwinia amylovora Ea644]